MTRNKDFENGMKFLFKKCKAMGIDIRKYPWVADLSRVLSVHNACNAFWVRTYTQDGLKRIPTCKLIGEFLYGQTAFFTWDLTAEGGEYWRSLLVFKLFDRYELYTVDKIKEIV